MTAYPKQKLNIDEVARDCRVSRRTVLRWIKNGEIESIKIGGTRRIFRYHVARWT